jgi:hypothetical protein
MGIPSNSVSHTLLAQIAEAIRTIRFGSVQILIHDGRVVQIEKAERLRVAEADLTAGGVSTSVGVTDRTTGGSQQRDGR